MIDNSTPKGASSGVTCWSYNKPHQARLEADGRIETCIGQSCLGFAGDPVWRTLAYGRHVDIGGFRCSSAETGITCIVVSSGKGFLINAAGVSTGT